MTFSARRMLVAAGVAMLLSALLTGCGDDDPASGASEDPATTAIPDETRPPTKFSELQAIFDPMLEPMGLELTRGALIDRAGNGYQVSEQGRHLALYAEPVDDKGFTPEVSVANFYDLTALLTPYVFERWSELDTFDICQEPPTSVDDRPEPFPDTQIDIPRQASEAFDWENSDLVDLLYLDLQERKVRTVFGERVREAEAYTAAYTQAQERATASIGTTTSSVAPAGLDD